MLPTKLARAAFRGMRSAAVPPEAVVVLMGSLLGVPAAATVSCRRWAPGGSRWRSAVRSDGGVRWRAVLRAAPGVTGRCSPVGAYVPTGYVPDGEVMAITLSSRRRGEGSDASGRAGVCGEPRQRAVR